MKSKKISILMLGLLMSPMLLQSASSAKADDEPSIVHTQKSTVSSLVEEGQYFGPTPARNKSSKNILDDLPKDNPFKYVHGDGTDLRQMAPDAYGRAATVQLYMRHADGQYTVGTGAFVGNRTILTVGHNFLKSGLDNTTNDITDVWFVVGSNSAFKFEGPKGNYRIVPTSGTMYHVDKSQLRFFNQQGYSSNLSDRKDKVLWENDVAAIQIKDPFPILAKKQGLKNDEVLRIAPLDELLQFNSSPVNTRNVVINGYPGNFTPGTKEAGTLKNAIVGGVQYRAASVIANKPRYISTGADLDSGSLFEFKNTAVGGMSGSSVLNEKGNVVGTYNFSTGGSTPDGVAGGVLFSKAHHTWITNLVKENTVTGWYDLDGTRYYLGEEGNIVKNKTLVIDGHIWSFDGEGRPTDKGEYFETKVFVKRVDESGKEIEARQEVGKATTLQDFEWSGATKYVERDAAFKEAWLLKTVNGSTDRKATIKAEKGKPEVEIVEVYQSRWQPLNRTYLTKAIEEVKAHAKDRESKLPTKGFEAYASAELAGKLNTAQTNYNKALTDAENLAKATDKDDQTAKRTQKVIDDAEKALRDSDKAFEPLLTEYAKAKRDERISAVAVLDVAAQYLEDHKAENTKSVKVETVKQYNDAKDALQKAIDAQTAFLASNKSNDLFKTLDLKNGTDVITKAQADFEATVAKVTSENGMLDTSVLTKSIADLDMKLDWIFDGAFTADSLKGFDTVKQAATDRVKEARALLSTGLTKNDQAKVDDMLKKIAQAKDDYLKAIDKFVPSEHNRVEGPKKPRETTEPRKVVPAVVVKEKVVEPVKPTTPTKPVETKPSEPVTPAKPVETKPSEPVTTEEPTKPVTPTIPTKPSEPVTPEKPVETKPSEPVTTEEPKQPEKPVTPTIPTKPSDPKDSTKPMETKSSDPKDSAKPTETKSSNPKDSAKPTETKSSDPKDATKPTETKSSNPKDSVKPKELPKTSEQLKQRNTAIVALLSVVGLGGLATYFGLRKRDEK
jgi:V8-like Glu-specific endopeptidase